MAKPTDADAATPGQRLYKIRLACGDGVRDPEAMDAFVARVRRKTAARYRPMAVSLLERMKQKWKLDDVRAFAAVDPLHRGVVWLAGFDEGTEPTELLDPRLDHKLTPEELRQAAWTAAAEAAAAKKRVARRKRPGGAA